MSAVNDASSRPRGAYRRATAVLSVFWPEAERAKLVARWPHLEPEVGATGDEHRRLVERYCVLVEENGQKVRQATGDVAGFEAFLQDRSVTRPTPQHLLGYPDLRTDPTLIPWPPARTAPCWCGSGRKYKQCCRPHGLGAAD